MSAIPALSGFKSTYAIAAARACSSSRAWLLKRFSQKWPLPSFVMTVPSTMHYVIGKEPGPMLDFL